VHKPKSKKPESLPNDTDRNPFRVVWPSRGGEKLVGGYIPRQEADLINLIALYRATTISEIFREAVAGILAEAEPEDHIIKVLATRAGNEWQQRLKDNQGGSGWISAGDVMARYREYQHEMRLVLIKRNISESFILRIIRKMETLYGVGGI